MKGLTMPNFLDMQTVELPCPVCGAKVSQSLGWIKANDHFVCSCGTRVDLEKSNFMPGMAEIDRSFADFERAISQFGGKRL